MRKIEMRSYVVGSMGSGGLCSVFAFSPFKLPPYTKKNTILVFLEIKLFEL